MLLITTVNESRKESESDSPLSREGGKNGDRTTGGVLPSDVRSRILASIPEGSQSSTFAQARKERDFLVELSGLPALERPATNCILTKGKEHVVVLKGTRVWKYQDGSALVPISKNGKLAVREALPTEYLVRLHLQNELFGDDIRVEGFLKNGKLVTSQSLIKGTQPTETEMTAMLKDLGWMRIPTDLHDLPHNLMATAWMHSGEEIVLVDARIPNFKKTESGEVLAIDLMLIKAKGDLLRIVKSIEAT